jgi:hypothetical protein
MLLRFLVIGSLSLLGFSSCQQGSTAKIASSNSDGGGSGGNGGGNTGGGSTSTPPTVPSISVSGLTSGYTNSNSVSISTSGSVTGIAQWCVSYTQSTKPTSTCSNGLGSGASQGWVSSFPTSISVDNSSSGSRTLYVWAKNSDGLVSTTSSQVSFAVDVTAPSVSVTTSSPTSGDNSSNTTSFTFSGTCADTGVRSRASSSNI